MRALITVLLCAVVAGLSACASDWDTQRAVEQLTPAQPSEAQLRARKRLALAMAYFEQGQNEAAMQEVSAALKIDPSEPGAYNLLGLIHQRAQAPEPAQQSFERAVYWAERATPFSPEWANAHHNAGWLHCQEGRYAQAQQEFQLALSQPAYPQASKTWMVAGLCQLRAGNTAAARDNLSQSLRLDGLNPVTRYQLALLDWQTQPAQAQALLAPIQTPALATPESLWLGVRVARALGQQQEMAQIGQQLMQRYPDSVQAQAWTQRKFEQP